MTEILAPAGNVECAKAAIHSGANAIYLGYQAYSARQNAENFQEENLREIIQLAHFLGVKVYVAMNTLVKDVELNDFIHTLLQLWNMGVDAVIMQDLYLGKFLHSLYPDIVLHLSTQAGVCNENGARIAKESGFSRVILARETPLVEIEKITKIIQTEVFIQGALCTCFSGQCYFSSFAGGNSGNRGRCKQPCRKLYAYDRKGNTEKNYALSLADLSVGEEIEKLKNAGVTSFKIEGRMRRAEYVAAAVQYYRAIVDNHATANVNEAFSRLKRTYNRGNYTKGLAFGQDKRFLSTAIQGHIGEKVGVVKVQNGLYVVESTFVPRQGDAFKILREGREVGGATFLKLWKRGFVISSKIRLKNGDGVFVTTDTHVNEELLGQVKNRVLQISLFFDENGYAKAESEGICVYSDERLQLANSRPLTKEEICECFLKTDGLCLQVSFAQVQINGNVFLPKSQLNAFRRKFYNAVYQKLTENQNTQYEFIPFDVQLQAEENKKIAVIAEDFDGLKIDIAIYKPKNYLAPLPKSFTDGNFEKYVWYPPLCTQAEETAIDLMLKSGKIDGVYADNYAGIRFAQTRSVCAFAGTGLNLFNKVAVRELLKEPNVVYYCVSKELNETERSGLNAKGAFCLTFGDLKIMDLCYCPFEKTCNTCDKKSVYTLTDEHGREFPVRRYQDGQGNCRFETFNCATLVGRTPSNVGALLDLTLFKDKTLAVSMLNDTERQKEICKNYTFGHAKRGVL